MAPFLVVWITTAKNFRQETHQCLIDQSPLIKLEVVGADYSEAIFRGRRRIDCIITQFPEGSAHVLEADLSRKNPGAAITYLLENDLPPGQDPFFQHFRAHHRPQRIGQPRQGNIRIAAVHYSQPEWQRTLLGSLTTQVYCPWLEQVFTHDTASQQDEKLLRRACQSALDYNRVYGELASWAKQRLESLVVTTASAE